MQRSPPAVRDHVYVIIGEYAPEKRVQFCLLGEPFEHSPFKRLFSISPQTLFDQPAVLP